MDLLKQQLDELMGKDRNIPVQDRNKRQEHYDDPEVCKFFLVSVCPHDLFPNTKCDLGVCKKSHDEHLKKMFFQDPNRIPYEKRYINETIRLTESLLAGVDAKIKKGQNKLDSTYVDVEIPKEVLAKMEEIDKEIKSVLQLVERLGEEGKIEESEESANQVELLKKKKEELKSSADPNITSKSLKVCEICGALQTLNDTEKKSSNTFGG